MDFAKNLRALRKRNGISQKWIAEKLGLAQQTVAKWECNGAEPSIRTLCALADYFNVTTDQLLGRTSLPEAKHLKVKVRRIIQLRRR